MKGLVSARRLLGVQHVEAPDYPDGAHQHYRSSLSAAITDVIRHRPDTVVTLGADRENGHPDHLAISQRPRSDADLARTLASLRGFPGY